MQHARFVWALGLLLVLGLAGFGSGCGPGSSEPMSQERSDQLRDAKKKAHGQLKADAKKIEADLAKKESAGRRGAHRGPAGR